MCGIAGSGQCSHIVRQTVVVFNRAVGTDLEDTMKHHAFSLLSVLFIFCFVIALTVAVFVDLAALL
jgi:hypothetical protein